MKYYKVTVTPWMQYLNEFFCNEDAIGNRPCDNGCPCDHCQYPEGKPDFEEWAEQNHIEEYEVERPDFFEDDNECGKDCYYQVGNTCKFYDFDLSDEPRECDRE